MLQETAEISNVPPSAKEGSPTADGHLVSAEANVRELTFLPLILGVVLGVIFGAASIYLVLKVGFTIPASIPIAVISVMLFRGLTFLGFRNRNILESNIAQTAGSAGESIAFGVATTVPALLLLGFDLKLMNILLLAAIGGLLGILLMIPFRRRLIVKGHVYLRYPEGASCADVLKAGAQETTPQTGWDIGQAPSISRRSSEQFSERFNSTPLFLGFGASVLFQTLTSVFKLSKEFSQIEFVRGTSIFIENNPALLGVGYIIGPRIAFTMAAGGAFSALMFTPFIKFFGQGSVGSEGLARIAEMSATEIRASYIIYVGVGALLGAALINFFRSLPRMITSLIRVLKSRDFRRADGNFRVIPPRTDRDLPTWSIVAGIAALTVLTMVSANLHINFFSAALMILLAVLFVAISARITGELGSTLTPLSAMTISTLLSVCSIFVLVGWTQPPYYATALSVGAIVCIAANTGGTTSQVLKTGYLVGATPRNQQIAILLGALISALVLGQILTRLNEAGTIFIPRVVFEKLDDTRMSSPATIVSLPVYTEKAKPPLPGLYRLLHVDPSRFSNAGLANGDYLVDEFSGRLLYHVRYNFSFSKVDVSTLSETQVVHDPVGSEAKIYHVMHVRDISVDQPSGKYLVDADGEVAYLVDPGINGAYTTTSDGRPVEKFNAPRAALMSSVIKGILTGKFPWALVLMGIMLAVTMELAGVPSLPFAVGVYLPFSLSTPILIGGFVRWLVKRKAVSQAADLADDATGPGVLLSSGFIVGAAIIGIVIALIAGFLSSFSSGIEKWSLVFSPLATGPYSDLLSFLIFMLLAILLYFVARRRRLISKGEKVAVE